MEMPLPPETAERLTELARQVSDLDDQRTAAARARDDAIVKAAEQGAGPVEIARAVGLSHVAVVKILRKRA